MALSSMVYVLETPRTFRPLGSASFQSLRLDLPPDPEDLTCRGAHPLSMQAKQPATRAHAAKSIRKASVRMPHDITCTRAPDCLPFSPGPGLSQIGSSSCPG